MLDFHWPMLFLLLPLPVVVSLFLPTYKKPTDAIRVPFFERLQKLGVFIPTPAQQVKRRSIGEFIWLSLCWLFLLSALAGPFYLGEPIERTRSARDLLFAVDLSQSMETKDFTADDNEIAMSRLQAVKKVLHNFVAAREHDRLGLILFADGAYLQAPFTEDHNAWLTLLNEADIGMAGQSTRFGDAIGLAIRVFDNSETDNRVLIVLTDGNDTGSLVPPVDAAKVAAHENIRIYTVAIGDPETSGEQALDVDVLQRIAELTEGGYYQALDNEGLFEVSKTIAAMEPEMFESLSFRPRIELVFYPVAGLLFLFCLPLLAWHWQAYRMR